MTDGPLPSTMEEALAAPPVGFTCPRCGSAAEARSYGPCQRCRDELRSFFVGTARDVEVREYEPKMNVTPNAVALKDD
jgi:hypothetical protein